MMTATRVPTNAGTFYPAEPDRLLRLVDDQLAAAAGFAAAAAIAPGALRGVIVPHAGLMYSGVVAAAGWTVARDAEPSTVVLLGTDHEARSTGFAVWTAGPWSSPLGEVAIDEPLAAEIAALAGPFHADSAPHAWEHSIEVQLPFLSRALPETRIVPVLVSPYLRDVEEIAGTMLGRLLAEHLAAGKRLLVVASSDFTHYPPADVAERVDAGLLEPILRLDASELLRREQHLFEERPSGVVCGLCGIDPVRLALTTVHDMGATHGILLRHATSADVAGADRHRTVGYASVALVA